jgi:hypothetical protein
VAFGILLFRYTTSNRKGAKPMRAADDLKVQVDRVWPPPRDTEQNYPHARHTDYGCTNNNNYDGLQSTGR